MIDSVGGYIEQRKSNYRAKAVSVLSGIALFFTVPLVAGFIVGDDSPFYLLLLVASYGVSGLILGSIWPDVSWRLGLWLYLIWPPMLLFMLFLGAEQSSNWKSELRDLFGYFLVLIAACLGARLGAFVRQQLKVG